MNDRRPNDSQLDWLWNNFKYKLIKGSGNNLLTEIEINKLIKNYISKIDSEVKSDVKESLEDLINSKIDLKLSTIVENRILPIIDNLINLKVAPTQEEVQRIINNINNINQEISKLDQIQEKLQQCINKVNKFNIQITNLNTKLGSHELRLDILDTYMREDKQFSIYASETINNILDKINYDQYYDE